jgi:uncharacterized protein
MTDIATTILGHARAGRFDAVREMFAPNLRGLVPIEALGATWSAAVARFGEVTVAGSPRTEDGPDGSRVTRVLVTFEHGALDLVVGLAGEWVVGINLTPPAAPAAAAPEWAAPIYADPATFDERDVTVDAMGLPVPGTLSVPHAGGRVPGVVLLAGSGPHDRDETIGVNKPLKDLAWGLATRASRCCAPRRSRTPAAGIYLRR